MIIPIDWPPEHRTVACRASVCSRSCGMRLVQSTTSEHSRWGSPLDGETRRSGRSPIPLSPPLSAFGRLIAAAISEGSVVSDQTDLGLLGPMAAEVAFVLAWLTSGAGRVDEVSPRLRHSVLPRFEDLSEGLVQARCARGRLSRYCRGRRPRRVKRPCLRFGLLHFVSGCWALLWLRRSSRGLAGSRELCVIL